MTKPDYGQSTLAELEQHSRNLSEQIRALRTEKRELEEAIHLKRLVDKRLAELRDMTPADRQAFKQLLNADGIVSGEAFGTPGE